MERLRAALARYLAAIDDPRLPAKVRGHDLRHMAFWHEYYAATVAALAEGRAPVVLRGTYKVINRDAQRANAGQPDDALIARISTAQTRLEESVPRLPARTDIPYKKGSRRYGREEYVSVIADHFDMHSVYLEKIAAGAPESFHVFHE